MNIIEYNIQELKNSKACVLVTLDQAYAVSKIDAVAVATDHSKYCRENKFSYYVLLNTWGNLILSESSEEAWYYIWLHIQQYGLIPCIRDCSSLADLLISGELPDWDYVYGYLGCLARNQGELNSQFATVLEVLRYPKRFSPSSADVITAASLDTFVAVNNEVRKAQHTEFSYYWVSRVRARIHDMLRGFEYDPDMGKYSSGSTASGSTTLIKKLKDFKAENANFYQSALYPIGFESSCKERWCGTLRPNSYVRLTAVPKTYKSARIIAMEPTVYGFALQSAMDSIRRTILKNKYVHLADTSDQTFSHEMCRLGSLDGRYATIDLSMASDRISESLVRSVFPQSFLHSVDPYRSTHIQIQQKKTRMLLMHMFATSGSPLTFDVQTILFSAIAVEVTNTISRFTGERLLMPRQFGDDAILDSRAADLFIEVLERFGAKPNMSKSFTSCSSIGFYRESCGVEYLNGVPMHGKYFPKTMLRLDADGIGAVCALQHRLYHCWKARLFLTELVKTLEPSMTAHVVGTDCADLWDVVDRSPTTQFRGATSEHAMRRKHSVLVTKYPTKNSKEYQSVPFASITLLEMWYYTQYLAYGPQYETELDRLLGVTMTRMKHSQDLFQPESMWRTVLE